MVSLRSRFDFTQTEVLKEESSKFVEPRPDIATVEQKNGEIQKPPINFLGLLFEKRSEVLKLRLRTLEQEELEAEAEELLEEKSIQVKLRQVY